MNEQRRQPRVPIHIYMNKYVDGVPYMTRSADISCNGIGLAHLLEPKFDKKHVGLQFQLPGSEEIIYAEGEIARDWIQSGRSIPGSYIRFTFLTEQHRKLVEAYVTHHISQDEDNA